MLRITLFILAVPVLAAKADPGVALLAAAKTQIGVTVRYDHTYQRIPYPNGDVPLERGVCTDVLVRAYRKLGFDLQALVHQDMRAAWEAYPKNWGMKGPDTNIDHRRVPNLATYFGRHGETLPVSKDPKAYRPGDIVVWRLSSGVPHIGLVSDLKGSSGAFMVIHNIGYGTKQDDRLFDFAITGHYRWFPQAKP